MDILSPNEISSTKSKNTEQSITRSVNAAAEESRIVKALNKAKQDAEEKMAQIKLDTDAYVQEQENRKIIAEREVLALEERRKVAMEPIEQVLARAEEVLKGAEEKDREAVAAQQLADDGREHNIDVADKLAERSDLLDEREEKLNTREVRIAHEERRLKSSSDTLASKWVEYHTAVNALNADKKVFDQQKKNLVAWENTLVIQRDEQKKKEREQSDKDRQIKDKYATIAKTVEEIENKHDIKIPE